MPGIRFNGTYNPEDKDVFAKGNEERKLRFDLITLYWHYYEGLQRKFLKITPGTYDDNVIINLCSQAVDRLASFVFPTIPGMKYSTKKNQKAVDRIWEFAEYIPTFTTDLGIAGLVGGHVYVRINASNTKNPRFVLLDPRLMTDFWDVTKPEELLWYRMTWADDKGQVHGEIYSIEDYVPSSIDPKAKDFEGNPTDFGWQIITYAWNPNKGSQLIEESREHWRYDFAPIVSWKAQPRPFTHYGPSLLRHLHINDVANFLFSNTNRILRFHAHPKTIILGAAKEELQQTAIDQVWAIPTTGAQVFNLEMQSELTASLMLYEEAKVAFFSQTHVVDTAANQEKLAGITNFGLHVLFSDMLDHTSQIRQLYGKGLQELIRRSMVIMGHSKIGNPQLLWGNPLPVNRSEHVNAVKVEQSIGGTSPQTLTESLDRDYDKEQERMEVARKEGLLNMSDDGIHEIDDLPLSEQADSSSERTELDDSDKLQRSIDSV